MAIKRAVDVAEIVRNRMESMMKIKVTYQDVNETSISIFKKGAPNYVQK